MREIYSGIASSQNILACTGKDGHLKGLFWPFKDSRHSHLAFSVCGFCIDGHLIWLDPNRDNLKMSFCPTERSLSLSWDVHHPALFGVQIQKKIIAFDSALTEQWSCFLPRQYNDKNLRLWCLSKWHLHAEREFQSIYSPKGCETIFAYSDSYWVGICASDLSGNQIFEKTRAIQKPSHENLGQVVQNFVEHPDSFRCIEMGRLYAGAITKSFQFFTSANKPEFLETHFFISYIFGKNQVDIENKLPGHLLSLRQQTSFLPREKTEYSQLCFREQMEHLKKVSLSVLTSLTDSSGALLAAPECDFEMRYSGGYGFVWPRDAAFCAMSLMQVGFYKEAEKILSFLVRVQEQNGDYFQRYDAKGQKSPAWCHLQADQLGLVLSSLAEFCKYERNENFLSCLRKGVRKLIDDLTSSGSLQPSFDLWEESYGQHFYSHVCAYGALVRCLPFFPELESSIRSALVICFNFCEKSLFIVESKIFARHIKPSGEKEVRPDISLLACIFPFSEFPLTDEIKRSLFDFCAQNLKSKTGVFRYKNDSYIGGSWILAGFWLAIASLKVKKDCPELRQMSLSLFRETAGLCNGMGFFAEQVEPDTGSPLWVNPLAWSHAFFLLAHKELQDFL